MELTGDGGGLRVRTVQLGGLDTALPIFLVIQQSPLLQTLEPPTFDGADSTKSSKGFSAMLPWCRKKRIFDRRVGVP